MDMMALRKLSMELSMMEDKDYRLLIDLCDDLDPTIMDRLYEVLSDNDDVVSFTPEFSVERLN
jgi:hypothetical protein